MDIITINTPFNIDLEFKLATFPKRVAAWLIDMVVISAYFYAMVALLLPALNSEALGTLAGYLFIILPVMAYQLVFEIFFNGQTLGKKAVGIKIIDKEGNEPSWGQFITRWMLCLGNLFIYTVPYAMAVSPVSLIGFIFIYLPDTIVLLVTPKSQRIGDLAAGTVVIDANYVTSINETIYREIEVVDYVPMFPQVMRLTDRDINGIRNLLDTKNPGKDTGRYMQQVVQRIKQVLGLETDLEGVDLLRQLLFDYNFIAGK
jgi:uncharacterized RDD family membrane protein YckC